HSAVASNVVITAVLRFGALCIFIIFFEQSRRILMHGNVAHFTWRHWLTFIVHNINKTFHGGFTHGTWAHFHALFYTHNKRVFCLPVAITYSYVEGIEESVDHLAVQRFTSRHCAA